jgi:hypothetical protein
MVFEGSREGSVLVCYGRPGGFFFNLFYLYMVEFDDRVGPILLLWNVSYLMF